MSGNYVGYEPAPPGTVLITDATPVGFIGWFHAIPSGYLRLNGQAVFKAQYPDLWSYAQAFLTGDQVANPGLFKDVDAANFALPKFDGLFVRGAGQVDANRVAAGIGVQQNDGIGSHTHPNGAQQAAPAKGQDGGANWSITNSGVNTGALTETRPVNIALIPCIKATRPVLATTPASPTLPATQAEQIAGTVADKYVAPATQQFHLSAAKAWVDFNGTGTVAIRDSYNVTSLTDNGTGDYTMNFTVPMASANYSVLGTLGYLEVIGVNRGGPQAFMRARNAGSAQVGTASGANSNTDGAATDISVCCFVVFGRQ